MQRAQTQKNTLFYQGLHEVAPTAIAAAVCTTFVAAMGNSRSRHHHAREYVPQHTVIQGNGDWLAVGGLSKHDGGFIVDELSEELGPMASLCHTPNGVSANSLGEALEEHVSVTYGQHPEDYTLNAAVQSMGLVFLLEAIANCKDKGVALPRLGTVLAFSSPTSTKDTVRHSEAQMIQALRLRGYHGGVVAGAIGKLQQDIVGQYRGEKLKTPAFQKKSLATLGREALQSALHDQWPRLWTDSIALLLHANLATANLAGTVGPHTTFLHCGDALTDDLVVLHAARNSLKGLAKQYDAGFFEIDTPGAQHGDIHAMRGAALDALQWVQTNTAPLNGASVAPMERDLALV